MNKHKDDDWSGSAKRPWMNPPMRHSLGAGRGSWRYAIGIIALTVIAVVVVLVLVETDHLSRGWAYAVLPVAIIAAAAARVLTIFKAGAEDKSND